MKRIVRHEWLWPDRSKVRFQTKRDMRVYTVRVWSRFDFGTHLIFRLYKRTRVGVNLEEDPTYLKKAKLAFAQQWDTNG